MLVECLLDAFILSYYHYTAVTAVLTWRQLRAPSLEISNTFIFIRGWSSMESFCRGSFTGIDTRCWLFIARLCYLYHMSVTFVAHELTFRFEHITVMKTLDLESHVLCFPTLFFDKSPLLQASVPLLCGGQPFRRLMKLEMLWRCSGQ